MEGPSLRNAKEVLAARLAAPPSGSIRTVLSPFAILTYEVDRSALRRLIPDRFEVSGLVSAVPFIDHDFRWVGVPGRHRFGQVNYRAYVVDRESGEPSGWFFGTTLGSRLVRIPRLLWQMPWHYAEHCYEPTDGLKLQVHGAWGEADVHLERTDDSPRWPSCFGSVEEAQLILTHPLDGYFRRLDGRLATYRVWHELIEPTEARVVQARFSVFEELGLISPAARPISALFCPSIEFWVQVPPRLL